MKKGFLILLLTLLAAACSQTTAERATLNLQTGWYNGFAVYYVTTDVSDAAMARKMGANYTPRLLDAIPSYPKPPHTKTILERVYIFPAAEQGNVLASIPTPLGPDSVDLNYSPIWLLYSVNWLDKTKQTTLRSEEAILLAEEQGWLEINRTDVVVNCPVVSIDGQRFLQDE